MSISNSAVASGIRFAAAVASFGGGKGRLLILFYHRVLRRPDPCLPGTIDGDAFDVQMKMIAECFRPMRLDEAVGRLNAGTLPRRAVSVTFDDGYADNCEVALPILKKYRVPATFFITTGYLNGGRMWNDTVTESVRRAPGDILSVADLNLSPLPIRTMEERGATARKIVLHLRRMPPEDRKRLTEKLACAIGAELPNDLMLSTEQLIKLADEGMEIGAHTVSHPILTRQPDDIAVNEIQNSRQILQEIVGSPISGFAYPNGQPGVDYNIRHVKAVANSGFTYAVSTASGTSSAATDRFQLPRLGPWDDNPVKFGLRLVREYTLPPSSLA